MIPGSHPSGGQEIAGAVNLEHNSRCSGSLASEIPPSRRQGAPDLDECRVLQSIAPDQTEIVRLWSRMRLPISPTSREDRIFLTQEALAELLRGSDGAAMSDVRSIAVFGTFDVQNYGDLLFPLIAQHKLASSGFRVLTVSPSRSSPVWKDTIAPIAVESLLDLKRQLSGIMIGGGNIIHARPVSLAEYDSEKIRDTGYASLWIGASIIGALRQVPVVWNAPGIPGDLERADRYLSRVLDAADYISVRDRSSEGFLGAHNKSIHVVPDTALDLSELWSKQQLRGDFDDILSKHGCNGTDRFIAIHVKAKGLRLQIGEIASQIEALSSATACVPILIALGPCHGDDTVARLVHRHLRCPHIDLSVPAGLRDITACLAHSSVYIGASLHGYIAACSYGVPGLLLQNDAKPKLTGLLEWLDRKGDLACDWLEGLQRARCVLEGGPPPAQPIPPNVRAALDRHWDQIRSTFLTPPSVAATRGRARLLVHTLRNGIAHEGLRWALNPLLNEPRRQSAADRLLFDAL